MPNTAPESVYVAKYGITPDNIAQTADDDARGSQANARVTSLQAQLIKAQGDYEALKTEVTGHWTTDAAPIKRAPDFMDADGEALKITGPLAVNDLAHKTPNLRLETTPGCVKINFTKSGADGINLGCWRAVNEKPVRPRFLSKTG